MMGLDRHTASFRRSRPRGPLPPRRTAPRCWHRAPHPATWGLLVVGLLCSAAISNADAADPITLNFQDIETRRALQVLADFTGLNLIASDAVAGRLTLRLEQVPWEQALDLILRTQGLGKRQVGNVLLVAPAAELAAQEELELKSRSQLAELAPLKTEFIQIRYANAADLVTLLSSGAGDATLFSKRGAALVDERTNAIILTDTAANAAALRAVIAQLDVPVRQVAIESRIVNANANFTERLGIRWGGAALEAVGDASVRAGGSLETLSELQNGLADPTRPTKITSPRHMAVDLAVPEAAATFGIGVTGTNYLIDLEISALASKGHAEVVARPTVITADKRPATIRSGVQIPYQEASSSGATSTSFKEAVLSLEVTPRITPNDRIIMDLNVNQDAVGRVYNGIPSIDTTAIATQVLVDDGETVVLGGMFRTDKNLATTKTPVLGDIPWLGRLFRRTYERDDKQELLIFITPRVVAETADE